MDSPVRGHNGSWARRPEYDVDSSVRGHNGSWPHRPEYDVDSSVRGHHGHIGLSPWTHRSADTSVCGHIDLWAYRSVVLGRISPWTHRSADTSVCGHIELWAYRSVVLGRISPWAHRAEYVDTSVRGYIELTPLLSALSPPSSVRSFGLAFSLKIYGP